MALRYSFLIVGLGETGSSVARFLKRRGISFAVFAHSKQASQCDELSRIAPEAPLYIGELKAEYLQQADQIVVSPGVPLESVTAIQRENAFTQRLISDIELFACHAPRRPIAAITGTNGKSTTAALLTEAARCAGFNVASGGNLAGDYHGSLPALDLIDQHADADLYVLELSSFQLETTHSLRPSVSVILNISPDHLDRYESFSDYRDAKLRIHRHSDAVIINREEKAIEVPASARRARHLSFGLDKARDGHFGIAIKEGLRHIAYGERLLISEADIALKGTVGLLNIQAMFAIGHVLGLPRAALCKVAGEFRGLAHRLQRMKHIGRRNGSDWYDDSKATNVAATCAALCSVDRPVVLIAGGVAKGADFKPLVDLLASKAVREVVLLGRDAAQIAKAIGHRIPYTQVETMQQAVRRAAQCARPGDCVLLSPACASLDLYKNYKERGEDYEAAYKQLADGDQI